MGPSDGPQRRPQATGRRGGLGPGGARDWLARPSDVTVRRQQRLPGVLVPGTPVPNARPAQRGEGPRADPCAGETRVLLYVFMTPLLEVVLLIYSSFSNVNALGGAGTISFFFLGTIS